MAMYRVRTQWTGFGGGPYLSTMFFDSTAGSAQQAADAVRAFWAGLLASMRSGCNGQVLADVYTLDPANGDATSITSTTTAALAASAGGEALPFATQGLVRWTTGVFSEGRQVRGRTFLPAMVETLSDAGRPTATIIATAQTQAGNLIAAANTELVIWKRPVGGAGGFMASVAGQSFWTEWAVLRSRRD